MAVRRLVERCRVFPDRREGGGEIAFCCGRDAAGQSPPPVLPPGPASLAGPNYPMPANNYSKKDHMPSPSRYIVTCTLVLPCRDIERCRLAERLLHARGFQSRYASEGSSQCTRSLEREFSGGTASALLEHVCRELESAIAPHVPAWRAFVQVCGSESAWATLQAGRATLRGSLSRLGGFRSQYGTLTAVS